MQLREFSELHYKILNMNIIEGDNTIEEISIKLGISLRTTERKLKEAQEFLQKQYQKDSENE